MEISQDNTTDHNESNSELNQVDPAVDLSYISQSSSVFHIDEGTAPVDYHLLDTKIKVHCCQCGLLIEPNPSNTCVNWLSKQVDILQNIETEIDIHQWRTWGRWDGPPWMDLERESNQMLTMLLKKIKGIDKNTKIIHSNFIYTEPHSRRMIIKIIIRKEVVNNTFMEKALKVIFIEK